MIPIMRGRLNSQFPNGLSVLRNAGKIKPLSLSIHPSASALGDAMNDNAAPVVLVVEDDWPLRLIAVEVVEDAGYVVIEAANADEAILILEGRADIAVIFTDVDMPGSMDGLKLAYAVRHRWPPIKIIIVSGKTHLNDADLPPDTQFFSKPYSVPGMISELRSLIAPPST
jgi:two-component system, response regulator PdtaR